MFDFNDKSKENIDVFLNDLFIGGETIKQALNDTNFATNYINYINQLSIELFFEERIKSNIIYDYSSKDIPQISNFDNGTSGILNYLSKVKDSDITAIGKNLYPGSSNVVANKKYGENHSNFASFFKLVNIDRSSGKNIVSINSIGRAFIDLSDNDKREYLKRVIYSQKYFGNLCVMLKNQSKVSIKESLPFLKVSTIDRRTPNIIKVINLMFEGSSYDFLLDKIIK